MKEELREKILIDHYFVTTPSPRTIHHPPNQATTAIRHGIAIFSAAYYYYYYYDTTNPSIVTTPLRP